MSVDIGFDEIAIVQPGRAIFAAFKRGTIQQETVELSMNQQLWS